MSEALKKFGKYFLLDVVAQGGMAEVFRARTNTPDGGGRLLAIKKVLPSYSKNPEFENMFRSEIKTTSCFTHPCIVQIYDYGEEENQLFLAMELVDGKNLRQILNRLQEQKKIIPIELLIFIGEQAASALAYAHAFKDKFTNESLNIVHRDVSPQNILISFDGAVKVIDFGIAKAANNMDSTRSGMIKGKPSYLSPEQITGAPLDGRSDLFSLGSVLWEVLTGKKLFVGDNEYGVIRQIENCQAHVKKPSLSNPHIPEDLDHIVMKCLQKNPNDRFANAEELQRALHRLLTRDYPEFNSMDLSSYIRDLFKKEILDDYKKLQLLDQHSKRLAADSSPTRVLPDERTDYFKIQTPAEPVSPVTPASPSPITPATQKPHLEESGARELDFKEAKEDSKVNLNFTRQSSSIPSRSIPIPKQQPVAVRKNPRPKWLVPAAITLIAGFLLFPYLVPQTNKSKNLEKSVRKASITVLANVLHATVTVNEKEVSGELPMTFSDLDPNQSTKVLIRSNGYRKFMQEYNLSPGEEKVVQVVLLKEGSGTIEEQIAKTDLNTQFETVAGRDIANGKTLVSLLLSKEVQDDKTFIQINGKTVSAKNSQMELPSGSSATVTIEREGYASFRRQFQVPSIEKYQITVSLESAKFGFISINTTPSSDAIYTLNGKEERRATPVTRLKLPVGKHRIRLVNTTLRMEKTVEVQVLEDKFTTVDEKLSAVE